MNLIKAIFQLLILGAIGAAAFVYFGLFDTAADVPHSPVVYSLLDTVRQRSVAVRASDIPVPPLNDPKMIADGAEHYREMCTGCHLAPGVTESEIRAGLYPQPPDLTRRRQTSPAEMFWTIKHGIKMSAMPAWGATHDNQAIWNIVAFLQELPGMTPEHYAALTHAPAGGEEGHRHHHEDGAGEGQAGHDHHGDEAAGAASPEAAHDHDHGAASAGAAHDAAPAPPAPPLSMEGLKAGAAPDAEQVALAFHRALQKGDREAVLALLSSDVTVSEAGQTQSRAEYAAGHLAEDIKFLKTAEVTPIALASMPMGDTAMVGSETEIRPKAAGHATVLRSREMLTLRRENGAWKITAIRWESGPAAAAPRPAQP